MSTFAFICTTTHFELENPDDSLSIWDFKLSNDKLFLYSMYPLFFQDIGNLELQTIENVPCFTSFLILPETIDENEFAYQYQDNFQTLLASLWFIKDCCAGVSTMFSCKLDKSDTTYFRTDKSFCNSEGRYLKTAFTIEELQKAEAVVMQVSKITNYGSKEMDSTNPKPNLKQEKAQKVVAPHTHLSFNKRHRIERALMFLHQARSESFLPLKISFYIGLYETLFTTDSSEVSHKVAERLAFYLGNNSDEKHEIFKLVKDAYGVRSSFMHGQTLSKIKVYNELAVLSKKIDELTRSLLNRIVFEDYEIFSRDNNNLNEWFIELILKDNKPKDQPQELNNELIGEYPLQKEIIDPNFDISAVAPK